MFSAAAAGHAVGTAASAVGCSPNTSRSVTGFGANQRGTGCLWLTGAVGNSSRKGSGSFVGGTDAAAVWLSQLSWDAAQRGSTTRSCLGQPITAKLNSPLPARNGFEHFLRFRCLHSSLVMTYFYFFFIFYVYSNLFYLSWGETHMVFISRRSSFSDKFHRHLVGKKRLSQARRSIICGWKETRLDLDRKLLILFES